MSSKANWTAGCTNVVFNVFTISLNRISGSKILELKSLLHSSVSAVKDYLSAVHNAVVVVTVLIK